jgi:hypothetical protein
VSIRPRVRWPAVAAALSLLVIGVAARALWVRDLEEDLVRLANETLGAPRPRPLHVGTAVPGRFAEALALHLPPLEREAKKWNDREDLMERLRAAGTGAEPIEALPSEYAQTLTTVATDVRGLLAGTHAELADLSLGDDPMTLGAGTWVGYQFAARLVAVEVRSALAQGKREEATELCLDGLALGRDAAVAGGLIGRMIGSAVVKLLLPACGVVVGARAADPDLLLPRLRILRDAVPAFEAVVPEESASMQLLLYGWQLSPERRARLHPRAAAWASVEPPDGWLEGFVQRLAWRDVARAYVELEDAVALRGDARRNALLAFERRWSASWHPSMKALAAIGPGFGRYALRDEERSLRLDLLVCAAAARAQRRASAGWPARLDDLVAADLLRRDEAERLRDLELAPEPGGGLTLRLPLPEIEGSERETVSLTLGP